MTIAIFVACGIVGLILGFSFVSHRVNTRKGPSNRDDPTNE